MPTPKMTVPLGGTEFARITPGLVAAKCYSIVDLGTQEVNFQGKITNQRKFQITFETKQMSTFRNKETGRDEQKPLVIGKRYTLSVAEKSSLKKDLKTWLAKEPGESFDIFSLIGKSALLQVIESDGADGKTYSNISVILPGQEDFELVNRPQLLSLEKGYYSGEDFRKVPEWMQKIIIQSPERKAVGQAVVPEGDTYEDNSDLPF